MIKFQETPAQPTGWKHGKTLFHRTLLTTAGGPTSTTAVDWHLKVKDIKQDVGQPKLIASQSAYTKSAQFTHSFLTY